MTTEQWKDIPDYEGLYQVSDQGHVKSLNYRGSGKAHVLHPILNRKRYLIINLYKNHHMQQFLVHRLVALAFYGPSTLTVNHIDGVKTNNHLSNLEYLTVLENIEHGHRIGLCSNQAKGERCGNAKLTETTVREIRSRRASGESLKPLGKSFEVDVSVISLVSRRLAWKHVE